MRFTPGVYRLSATSAVSGAAPYATGTVAVTNGSAVVTGSGTSWLANAFANGIFQVQVLAHGTDGVANGTTTFTSAAGNFQAGHVGMTIRIGTKAAYTIAAVASASSITLSGSPTAASSLTYDVGPESPYTIQSVDSNTQITLSRSWSGPSFTGLSYLAWRDIVYVGDQSGVLTDGIGGMVRITGSDNDVATTRTNCIVCSNSQRTFRGLQLDGSVSSLVSNTGANVVVEGCTFSDTGSDGVNISGAGASGVTVRRCASMHVAGNAVTYTHSSTVNDAAGLVENCLFQSSGGGVGVNSTRIGGVLARNITATGLTAGVKVTTSPASGQAMTINNCLLVGDLTGALATATTDTVPDYIGYFSNNTSRSNVSTGAHDQFGMMLMNGAPLLMLGLFTWVYAMLQALSEFASKAQFNPPGDDLFGAIRSATSSWGAVQYVAGQRPVDAGLPRSRVGQ